MNNKKISLVSGTSTKLILLILFVVIFQSCGASNSSTGRADSGFFPKIKFILPKTVTTASLPSQTALSGTDVLTDWNTKLSRTVDYINYFFIKLNDAKIVSGNGVVQTLESGNVITVTIGNITNDIEYQHQAVICE